MALFENLRPAHLVRDVLRTLPRGSQALPFVEPSGQHAVQAPRLLRTYLELSAKICGPPAIDRELQDDRLPDAAGPGRNSRALADPAGGRI